MKALTVNQPYASLIMAGLKRYETRAYATTHRGPLAIHAGKRWQRDQHEFYDLLRETYPMIERVLPELLPLGCILGICDLKHAYMSYEVRADLSELEIALGGFGAGRYAWHLVIVERCAPPIAARGQFGLWEWRR